MTKPSPSTLDTEAPATLAAYLDPFGYRARVVLERVDGAPLTESDRAALPVIVDAFGGQADAGRSDDELAGLVWREQHPGEARPVPSARKTG